MSNKKIYQKREFLNTNKTESAFVIASISKDVWTNKKTKETLIDHNASLDISDCNRKISLDFYCEGDKQIIKQRLAKIAKFRKIVNEFADALESTLTETLENLPKKKPNVKTN